MHPSSHFPIPRVRILTAVLLPLVFLSACSNLGRRYDEIDPEGAAIAVKAGSGYDELTSVNPGTSKMVLRSEGKGTIGLSVRFATTDAEELCSGFVPIGTTVQSARGVLLPGIARMTEKMAGLGGAKTFLVSEPRPGRPLQVLAFNLARDETAFRFNGSGMSSHTSSCGPVVSRFTPAADHAYLIRFTKRDAPPSCALEVLDATNPEAPIPVSADFVRGCDRP